MISHHTKQQQNKLIPYHCSRQAFAHPLFEIKYFWVGWVSFEFNTDFIV